MVILIFNKINQTRSPFLYFCFAAVLGKNDKSIKFLEAITYTLKGNAESSKKCKFVVMNVSLTQASLTLFYPEKRKEYTVCTQRKIDYFMMKYWIERELGFCSESNWDSC